MKPLGLALLGLALVLCSGSSARAQEAGQTGVTIGYPEAIGIIWHASDGFALRPEFSFKQGSNESISVLSTTFGISGIIYVGKWDALRAYVSPRFAYQRDSSTILDNSVAPPPTTTYVGGGSFGFQYSFQPRFGVYGEAGIEYSRSSTTFEDVTAGLHSVGTRAGLGLIFYF